MRWIQARRHAMQLAFVLLTALSLSLGGLQDAHAITITSVQPYISVTYDHREFVNGGSQFLYTVHNAGATTAPTVDFAYLYTWLANGPAAIETKGNFTIKNLKAGDTTHVAVFCPHGDYPICQWSYISILPGNYLRDPNHTSAWSP